MRIASWLTCCALVAGCLQNVPPLGDAAISWDDVSSQDAADTGSPVDASNLDVGAPDDVTSDTLASDVVTDTFDDDAPTSEPNDTLALPDGTFDLDAVSDTSPETTTAPGDAITLPPEDTPVAEEPLVLTIEVPVTPRPDMPFPVLVTGPPNFTGPVDVDVQGTSRTVLLHRGRGSFSMVLETAQNADPVAITALGDWSGETTTGAEDRGERLLLGELVGDDLAWDSANDIRIDGVVTIPPGELLAIGPNTRILLEPNARIELNGSLITSGPVLFSRGASEAWGGLVVQAGGSATLNNAWFLAGGGDGSKTFGHSNSQPVVKASSGLLVMNGGGVLDSPGKGIGGYKATMSLSNVLISRCDTGGELVQSKLTLTNSHVVEIPDADGVATDDDNDGLYFVGVLNPDDASSGSTLTDVVFSLGEDDGIDHNDANLTVIRGWIHGFAHEGIATSGGNTVLIEDTVVTNCDQGIEAGYGSPAVAVRRCLLANNRVGLRFGDSYEWADEGQLVVNHSVSVSNTEANVLNLTDLGGPKLGAIQISCSMVNDVAFDGKDDNLAGVPTWSEDGCVDAPMCNGDPIGPSVCE